MARKRIQQKINPSNEGFIFVYIASIPSKFFASTPIIYETTATDNEIAAIVAKFLKNGSSFATDM